MIVTFSGMDDAGKTTQINKLIFNLENNNKDVSYIWARDGYTLGLELFKTYFKR
jgi:thymidylate kinase